MGELAVVNRFIESSRAVRSPSELHDLCDSVTREMGFDYFALVQIDLRRKPGDRGVIAISSYPASWVADISSGTRVEDDPAFLASCRSLVGFRWSEMDRIIRLGRRQKVILARSRRAGISDGYTVPAHIPGETNGLATFAVGSSREVPERRLPMAQLAGTFAYEAARRIRRQSEEVIAPVGLTPRQVDCVLLVARGKTDWEISRILGVSEETVSEHIDGARARYGVARRTQLVVRAIHDGHFALTDALH
jgi:LuxR family transcriptional regulator, quorum-sensing system regulator CciR